MTDITQQHIAVLVKRLRTTVMPRRTSPQDKAIIDNLMDAADMLEQLAAERAKPANATPRSYLYRYSDPFTGKPVWRSDGGLWNGQRPKETLPLYEHPAPDARTYTDGVRDAAKVAEYEAEYVPLKPGDMTRAILALLTEKDT